VPVRFIAEALGATVDWNFDGAVRKAVVQKGRTTVEIMIGSPVAYVNVVEVALDSPAFIENYRTYLPLRFVVESLGASVTWDGDVGEIIITG
ncbi:MAG: copper amine oxidase N-terminal domain-containing protein, partial [Clostridia bacterium]|nr:copper amine oxidase N-terminal domain-containing protein [Clostridia bacterium]